MGILGFKDLCMLLYTAQHLVSLCLQSHAALHEPGAKISTHNACQSIDKPSLVFHPASSVLLGRVYGFNTFCVVSTPAIGRFVASSRPI